MQTVTLDMFQTLAIAALAHYVGLFLQKKIRFFRRFCIPVPVIGGTVIALLTLILYVTGAAEISFADTLKDVCMVFFFTTVGFGANLKLLKSGSKVLIKLILLIAILAVSQNLLTVGLATLLKQNPLIGLGTGSVSFLGGHGTAAAFAPLLEEHGLTGALTICSAAATFGLIAGSLSGGPLANHLIRKKDLIRTAKPEDPSVETEKAEDKKSRAENFAKAAFQLAIAVGAGTLLTKLISLTGLVFPQYIGSMFFGCIISNVGSYTGKFTIYTREIEDIGAIMLELFLGMALISLKIWQLFHLALPLVVLLLSQTVFTVLFARFAAFRFLGKDYDAAVMTSGVCGFSMGATPNALSNMQAVTANRPASRISFLVIPITGGIFLDIINGLTIVVFLNVL